MDDNLKDELPFMKLSDVEMRSIFSYTKNEYNFEFNELKTYISQLHTSSTYQQLDFNYYTQQHFNHSFRNMLQYKELAVFHLNIRSLNCNCSRLIELLDLLETQFDVIVLSEICTHNIVFYSNILVGYDFYYDLPEHSKIGGVGIFVRSEYKHCLLPQYKLKNSDIVTEKRFR